MSWTHTTALLGKRPLRKPEECFLRCVRNGFRPTQEQWDFVSNTIGSLLLLLLLLLLLPAIDRGSATILLDGIGVLASKTQCCLPRQLHVGVGSSWPRPLPTWVGQRNCRFSVRPNLCIRKRACGCGHHRSRGMRCFGSSSYAWHQEQFECCHLCVCYHLGSLATMGKYKGRYNDVKT